MRRYFLAVFSLLLCASTINTTQAATVTWDSQDGPHQATVDMVSSELFQLDPVVVNVSMGSGDSFSYTMNSSSGSLITSSVSYYQDGQFIVYDPLTKGKLVPGSYILNMSFSSDTNGGNISLNFTVYNLSLLTLVTNPSGLYTEAGITGAGSYPVGTLANFAVTNIPTGYSFINWTNSTNNSNLVTNSQSGSIALDIPKITLSANFKSNQICTPSALAQNDIVIALGSYSDGPELIDCVVNLQDGRTLYLDGVWSGPPNYYKVGKGVVSDWACYQAKTGLTGSSLGTWGPSDGPWWEEIYSYPDLSQCTLPQTCQDPNANNFEAILPCAYPPVELNMSVDPSNVSWTGGNITLSWSTFNATECTASGDWSGTKSVGSNQTQNVYLWPFSSSKTYTLTCSGQGLPATKSVSVGATNNNNNGNTCLLFIWFCKPNVQLTASPTILSGAGDVSLSWTTSDADYCIASDGWTGAKNNIGGVEMVTVSTTTNFGLACGNSNGTTTDIAFATVNAVNTTTNSSPQCSDGIDNDADGNVDFPYDPGCNNSNDDTEYTDNSVCNVNCDSNSGNVGNNVDTKVSGFTISGGSKLAIRFLSGLSGRSQTTNISVNPASNFSEPVILSVESIRSASGASLPSDVIPTYYFGESALPSVLMSYNHVQGYYLNSEGLIGTTFAVALSKKITEKYYITIVGVSDTERATYVIELDPKSVAPSFMEI